MGDEGDIEKCSFCRTDIEKLVNMLQPIFFRLLKNNGIYNHFITNVNKALHNHNDDKFEYYLYQGFKRDDCIGRNDYWSILVGIGGWNNQLSMHEIRHNPNIFVLYKFGCCMNLVMHADYSKISEYNKVYFRLKEIILNNLTLKT